MSYHGNSMYPSQGTYKVAYTEVWAADTDHMCVQCYYQYFRVEGSNETFCHSLWQNECAEFLVGDTIRIENNELSVSNKTHKEEEYKTPYFWMLEG